MSLKAKREERLSKQQFLAKVFSEAGDSYDMGKVTSLQGDSGTKVAEIQRLNKELEALGIEIKGLEDMEQLSIQNKQLGEQLNTPQGFQHPEGKGKDGARAERKTLGRLFVEAKGHRKSGSEGPMVDIPDYSVKTLFQRSAGFAPESTRTGPVEMYPVRQLVVADLPTVLGTTQAAVKYMEQTTRTNNAAEAAEGATYGEAAMAFTERSVTVEKIAVYLPVTDEQLEDEEGVEDMINAELEAMVMERLDSQLLVGNGSTPNIMGYLNAVGVQTQALGTDPVPDAIFKAMVKVMHTGFAQPDAVVLHPNDWTPIRLARTADGIYIWGNPSDRGPQMIWGLPVVVTPAETENTGLVGAFRRHSRLYVRRGIRIQVSNSHSDYFINGKQAIRADLRVANVIRRPLAFCKVTGI